MFGIGPTEMVFFLVILLLAVGPEKLPTFMRTVGKGVRQVRNASREFKDAIGLDELMRETDPFRNPNVRPPRQRPVPVEAKDKTPPAEAADQDAPSEGSEPSETKDTKPTAPPPVPPPSEAARIARSEPPTSTTDPEPPTESDKSAGTNHP